MLVSPEKHLKVAIPYASGGVLYMTGPTQFTLTGLKGVLAQYSEELVAVGSVAGSFVLTNDE